MENSLIFPKEWSNIHKGMIGGYEVIENVLIPKNSVLVLKEINTIICGDIYLYAFKTFDIETAADLCIGIAQNQVSTLIKNFKY